MPDPAVGVYCNPIHPSWNAGHNQVSGSGIVDNWDQYDETTNPGGMVLQGYLAAFTFYQVDGTGLKTWYTINNVRQSAMCYVAFDSHLGTFTQTSTQQFSNVVNNAWNLGYTKCDAAIQLTIHWPDGHRDNLIISGSYVGN